jgi:hypothetical protein
MDESQADFTPRAERFAVKNLDATYAMVERIDDHGETTNLLAEPLDISQGGVKLRLDAPLNFEETIRLVLGCVEGPLRLTLTCRVAWLRTEWDGLWLVGCQFIPQLPTEVLEQMFSSGWVERRRFHRCAANGTATARWQLSPDQFKVDLIDVSQGGFCIRCRQAGCQADRIQLCLDTIDGPVTVQARAKWRFNLDEQSQLIGCEFQGRNDYVCLNRALESAEAASTP